MAAFTTAEGGTKRDLTWGTLAVCLGLLVFAPTLFNQFVFDDHFFVEANRYIRHPGNIWLLVSDWRTNGYNFGAGGFWRPLRNISYLVDYMIGGNSPAVFHLGNLLWHSIAIAGLFVLARRLGLSAPFAFLAAAVFAVHPVQTESVAWVKERDGLMCAGFLFWSLVGAIGRGWRSAAASLLFAVGALLTKETAVVYTPLVLACGWVASRGEGAAARYPRRFLMLAAGGCLLTIFYLVLRQLVLGQIRQADVPPGGTYLVTLWTMPRVFLQYLRIVVLPTRLELFYQWIRPAGFASPLVWAGIAVLAAMLMFVYTERLRRPVAALGVLWFLLALAPVSNFIPTLQWMAVRFLYIPMAGLGLAAGALGEEVFTALRRRGRDRAAILLAAAILCCWSAMSLFRATFIWRNDATLWGEAYSIWPERYPIAVSYAEQLLRPEFARADEAAAVMADYPFDNEPTPFDLAWKVRMDLLSQQEMWDEARAIAETAVSKFPENPGILTAAGFVQARTGHTPEAIALWEKVLALDPYNVTALQNLATAYSSIGDDAASARVTAKRTRILTLPREQWDEAPTK